MSSSAVTPQARSDMVQFVPVGVVAQYERATGGKDGLWFTTGKICMGFHEIKTALEKGKIESFYVRGSDLRNNQIVEYGILKEVF